MTREFFENVDWKLLQDQKNWLLNYPVPCEAVLGLIELIDNLQDYTVDELGMDENVVFNFKG